MRTLILVACFWLATSSLYGKIVFYSTRDGNHEIYTMDPDGNNQKRLTFNETADASPAWSPNGQQIVFYSYRDGNAEVYVMDADGNNQRRLTNHPASDGYPYWTPDGKQIAFDSTRDAKEGEPKVEIYVMDTDGDNVRQVTNVGFATRPRWSSDGEWILFEAGEIFAIRPDGTDMWQVSNPRFDAAMFLGGWSPDGKQVLYAEAVNFNPDKYFPIIATLAQNGRQEVLHWKPVNVPRMPMHSAIFSANGKSILFSGAVDMDNNWHIYRFELIGQKLIQLTNSPGEDTAPQEWSPRLSVPPQQGLLPLYWGQLKTAALQRRANP